MRRRPKAIGGGGGKTAIDLDLGSLNPKQSEFFESKALFTAYGGARGGGKTHALRVRAITGALEYPGIRILIIRRTYPELQQNHIEPILKTLQPLIAKGVVSYNGAERILRFSNNGSIIKFGHYSGQASELEYQGQEYDWIFLDEATQFTERDFRTLCTCLRGANKIPKRFYLTCNPGGVGHNWVKRLFIDKQYKTDCDNPEENENPKDYKFIFASIDDNVHMKEADPIGYANYLRMLSQLPDNLREAWRYGKWDVLGGNYFPEFSEETHVIKSTFHIPDDWARYRAFDYGLDKFACYWIAVDQSGRCYVYREFTAENMIVSDAAGQILEHTLPQERIVATYAPPDMWSRQKDTGKTMAEIFMQCGVGLVKSSNNRVQGHMQIKEMLKIRPDGKPGLLIFDTCKQLISDLKVIQADENDPNDCAKEPHEITHTVDALRYFCVMRAVPNEVEAHSARYLDDDDEDYVEDYDAYMTGGAPTASYLYYGGGL